MNTNFDWAAFQSELDKSTSLNPSAKDDIKRAIAAGEGKPRAPIPAVGQIWKSNTGHEYMAALGNGGRQLFVGFKGSFYWIDNLSSSDKKNEWQSIIDGYSKLTFVANSLAEYVEKGGSLK